MSASLHSWYASLEHIAYAWLRNTAVLRRSWLSGTGIIQRFRPFPRFDNISEDVSAIVNSSKSFEWKARHWTAGSLITNVEAPGPNDSTKLLQLPADWRVGALVWGCEIIKVEVVASINAVSDLQSWQKVRKIGRLRISASKISDVLMHWLYRGMWRCRTGVRIIRHVRKIGHWLF